MIEFNVLGRLRSGLLGCTQVVVVVEVVVVVVVLVVVGVVVVVDAAAVDVVAVVVVVAADSVFEAVDDELPLVAAECETMTHHLAASTLELMVDSESCHCQSKVVLSSRLPCYARCGL